MNRQEIKDLQHGMNVFVKKYLRGLGNIEEDGRLGPSTFGRVRRCKYYLGYEGPVNGHINMDFRQRLYHPNSRKYSTYKRIRRGQERRIRQRRDNRKNDHSAKKNGVGRFDGIAVANAAIPILEWCRHNGWHGNLVSGWRDPRYSRGLCIRMCGRPFCPGLCAGMTSNHVGNTPQRFACDVSQYWQFRAVVARCPIQPRIFNRLPRDPVHFSPSGN